ncbi:MAG: transglutaminase domain-containing protein [Hyphomicrobium sp.]
MRVSIGHVTRYTYGQPSRYSIQSLRLTPPSFKGQRVLEWRITAPGFDKALQYRDGFGNTAHLTTCVDVHSEILIIAKGVVETEDRAGVVQGLQELTPRRVFLRQTEKTTATDAVRDLISTSGATTTLEGLHALMDAVRDAIEYEIGATSSATTADEALAAGKGVCQDHAHVFIAATRAMGLPSRYVNGYYLSGSDEPSEAHHAWAEVWVESLGWVGFDAANRMCPTDAYVRLACGLDSASAAPIRGTRLGGAYEALDVIVEVQQQNSQQQ